MMDYFRFPNLGTRAGKSAWIADAPIYWAVAFLIAAAVPQASNLSGFIAAACILQFTYTFPPLLHIGFLVKKDALQPGEGYDPATGNTVRLDTGMKRWAHGYMQRWMLDSLNMIFFWEVW